MLEQTKSYSGQKCVKAKSQRYVEGQGLKEGGATSVGQQWCPSKE